MRPDFAQDPRELFDVVNPDGTPTGRTKARADVHRDGDWHRAVHVWVTGLDEVGQPFLLFQRRSELKDTWPGRLDATVGGHYRAGETLVETLRETEEEIGVAVSLDDLRPIGVRVAVNERDAGVRDHELQDVFLLRRDSPLSDYSPNSAELSALVQVPLADLLDLMAGEIHSLNGMNLDAIDSEVEIVSLTIDDFIVTIDRYFYRAAIAAQMWLQGERHIAV